MPSLLAFLFADTVLMLLQRNAGRDHMDRISDTVVSQNMLHLLSRSNNSLRIPQPQFGKLGYNVGTEPLTWQNIGNVLLVERVICMDDGSAGLLGNICGEMIAEIFTLAVNYVRLPFNQIP